MPNLPTQKLEVPTSAGKHPTPFLPPRPISANEPLWVFVAPTGEALILSVTPISAGITFHRLLFFLTPCQHQPHRGNPERLAALSEQQALLGWDPEFEFRKLCPG